MPAIMETAPLGRTDTVFRLGKVKPLVKGLWHNITSADLNPVAELTFMRCKLACTSGIGG